jgi:FG-GAP-like repeat
MVWKCLAEMRTVGTLLLLVFASIIAVGLEKVAPARNAPPHGAGPHEAGIVPEFDIEDFDGDSRPDIATVVEGRSGAADNHYRIKFQLSSGGSQNIEITAPVGGLDLSSRDVNGDDYLDVVVTTARTNRPVAVLLNNGAGTFTASDPSAFPEAFRKSNKFWSGLTEELREGSPAFFSRIYSSDLDRSNATFSLLVEIEVFAKRFNHLETRDAEVSHLGRAPPFLKHTL